MQKFQADSNYWSDLFIYFSISEKKEENCCKYQSKWER